MSVWPIVALALFATVALLLPSTNGTKMSEVQANIKKLQEQVAQIQSSQANINKLQEQVAQLSQNISQASKTADAANKVVAFHAHHQSDPFSVASQGTIVYKAVSINTGNGYDSVSGIFTAPVSGTYSFFINCMAVDGKSEEPSILVNGATIASCYSWKPTGQPWEQGATQGIAHLNSGDRVWVRMLENAQQVRGAYWNTFSGFLIRADV